jgi:hypothetical protein
MLRPNGPVTAEAGRGQQASNPGTALGGAGQFAPAGQFEPGAQFAPAGQFGAGQVAGQRRGRGRLLALAAGGTVLAVAVVAYLAIGRGHGAPGPATTGPGQATASGGAQNALGPGAGAPGTPEVTAKRASATKIRFHWTYTGHAAGDIFRWRRVGGTAGSRAGVTATPQLLVKVSPGQSVCIVVQVRRVNGEASSESSPGCWAR